MDTSSIILKAENITKIYKEGSNDIIKILEDSSFNIYQGESVAFIGPSGCGKTTLLQICGLLDSATEGDIIINNISTKKLNDYQKTQVRKDNIGFIFQMHHLFPEFTALENVMLPLMIRNENTKIAKQKSIDLLTELGLENRINHIPAQLSGGEKQRVAIARALITSPKIILADEPTGNLDDKNTHIVLKLLLDCLKKYNASLLMVTHNKELADKTSRVITIQNHKIVNI